MIRSRPLQDALARLAFLAMLALVVLPTLGRLHAPTPIADAASGHDRDTPPCHAHLPGPPAPDRPQAPHDGDCAYCPLLANLASPTVATWAPMSSGPIPPPARTSASPIAVVLRTGHLGPRGPPVTGA